MLIPTACLVAVLANGQQMAAADSVILPGGISVEASHACPAVCSSRLGDGHPSVACLMCRQFYRLLAVCKANCCVC